ncbi:MAG: WcbI family polysaccharide biosynthesis putative acetyltransferase [Rhodospirillaceae bacterium]
MSTFRRILITAFCQTPGLASALKLLFPDAEIYTRASLAKKDAKPEEVAQLLAQLDVWVNAEAGEDFFSGGAFAASHPNLRYVSIPLLEFAAFHPDVCNAGPRVPGQAGTVEYTSVIAVSAYRTGMTPADGAKLFNQATYANLGYLSEWDRSVERLREIFAASSLAADFERFYRRVKRLGAFMYSATHPRPVVLSELAKLVARKLGKDDAALDVEVPALDVLSHLIWPVYPEIARNLSIPSGGYVWQFPAGARIEGLENFLAYSFDQFRAKGLTPAQIGVPGVDMDRAGRAMASGV